VFRSVSVACLVAMVVVIAFWVCVARYTASDALEAALQIVLPPVILFFIGLAIDRSFHLSDRIAERYGYRRVGVVAYVFLAMTVALTRSAMNDFSVILMLILIIGALLPGLLLAAWWMLHKIAGTRTRAGN